MNSRYKKILNNISANNEEGVCLEMASVGMYDAFNTDVLDLIKACIKSDNIWIRKSAIECMYHLYVYKKENVCSEEFINCLLNGVHDSSTIVREMALETISEIKEFSPSVFKKIENRTVRDEF